MKKLLESFLKEEDGLGTVEIILIIAVLVGVALIFRNQLINFVNKVIGKVLPDPDSIQNNKDTSNMFLDTKIN
jgi:Flp pilus assembly pilin Flp